MEWFSTAALDIESILYRKGRLKGPRGTKISYGSTPLRRASMPTSLYTFLPRILPHGAGVVFTMTPLFRIIGGSPIFLHSPYLTTFHTITQRPSAPNRISMRELDLQH